MNCRKIKRHFSAYFEGDLSSEKVGAVRIHLQTCQTCRRELEDFRRTIQLVSSMPMVEPSIYFEARLRAKLIQVEGRRTESGRRNLGFLNSAFHLPTSALIATFLLLVVGWQLYQSLPPHPSHVQTQNIAQRKDLSSALNSSTQYILPDISISKDNSNRWRDFNPKEFVSNEFDLNEVPNLKLVLPSVSSSGIEPETDYILKKVSFSEGEAEEL